MSQATLAMPTVGTVSGLTFSQDVTSALDALVTCSSGSVAPINAQSGAPEEGQFWIDTTVSATPTLKQYINGFWLKIAVLDGTNGIWTPPVAGGALVTITAAATTDLGAQLPAAVNVTSAAGTAITSLGSSAIVGTVHFVTFLGASPPLLTQNSSSLILPTGANIQTAAGDNAVFFYLGSGQWRCLVYQLASGAPLSTAAVGAAQLVASSQGMNAPLNLRINAVVSGSQLTVSLVTAANATPSSTSPVLIPFRDPTQANGDPIIASVQSALSFTAATGNMLGTNTTGHSRLWVCAYYNGGTPAIGLFAASNGALQLYPLIEEHLVTTAASTNGGNSGGVHYANVSSITNTPFRIIGTLEWNTAAVSSGGTWATGNNPDTITLFGPGSRKPGDVVQVAYFNNGTNSGNSSGSMVQSNNGGSITPTSAANLIVIDMWASVNVSANAGAYSGINSNIYRNLTTSISEPVLFQQGPSSYNGYSCIGFPGTVDAPQSSSSVSYYLFYQTATAGHGVNVTCGSTTIREIVG
jgi:hypothetical protein